MFGLVVRFTLKDGAAADFDRLVEDTVPEIHRHEPPRWPTWGVKLSGKPSVTKDRPVQTAIGIAVNCLETLTADWNRYRLEAEGVNRRTIFVDTTGVAATDFGIDAPTRQRLFDDGQAAAQKFIANLPAEPTSS